jgi:hypothetical protein
LVFGTVVVCILGSDLGLPLAAEPVEDGYFCALLSRGWIWIQDGVKSPDSLLPANESA